MATLDVTDIVDLAEQLRALGASEFSVGDVRVVFATGSVPEPRLAVREDTDVAAAESRAMNESILARAIAQNLGPPKFPGQV